MNDTETVRYEDRPDHRPDLRDGLAALKDRVLTRSHTLEPEQRALLRVILDQGSSFEQVARLRGEHASTVSRRFRRLLRTLSRSAGGTVGRLNPTDETILSAYYLCGMNQSHIAARLGISRYRVRKSLTRFEPSTAKHPSSLPELRRTDSLTVPPVEPARSMTVAAQKRSVSCTR